MWRMDFAHRRIGAVSSVKLSLKPSDYVKRQVYATFIEKPILLDGYHRYATGARLPADRAAEKYDGVDEAPFRQVYLTNDERALELSNSTVHAILHSGWVPQADGTFRGQIGVYVKPRGWFGPLYMALMRRIGRSWEARA